LEVLPVQSLHVLAQNLVEQVRDGLFKHCAVFFPSNLAVVLPVVLSLSWIWDLLFFATKRQSRDQEMERSRDGEIKRWRDEEMER